jgi:hypothetical protein
VDLEILNNGGPIHNPPPEFREFCEREHTLGENVRNNSKLSLFLAEREFMKGLGLC